MLNQDFVSYPAATTKLKLIYPCIMNEQPAGTPESEAIAKPKISPIPYKPEQLAFLNLHLCVSSRSA
jgi:hypothetical protein